MADRAIPHSYKPSEAYLDKVAEMHRRCEQLGGFIPTFLVLWTDLSIFVPWKRIQRYCRAPVYPTCLNRFESSQV